VTYIEDARAVDPIAYIRAVGLHPEDSFGFLPLDLHDGASYVFLYRDRTEYAQARAPLPAAERVRSFDLGMVAFDVGTSRAPDVEVPAEQAGGRLGDIIAQAQALQQQYGGVDQSGREQQLKQLRDTGVLDESAYEELLGAVQGGHAGPSPGGTAAAPAAPDAPPIVVHRLFPELNRRSSGAQLGAFLPGYRDALGLCPEDVYGVFPRRTRSTSRSQGGNNIDVWEDYWIVYRDRPEYAGGREAWASAMNEPRGLAQRMVSKLAQNSWPPPEVVPGVAGPGAATVTGTVKVDDAKLEDVKEAIGRRGYAPEDSFGVCPDFNQTRVQLAWRS
jgi:hypothetical protein